MFCLTERQRPCDRVQIAELGREGLGPKFALSSSVIATASASAPRHVLSTHILSIPVNRRAEAAPLSAIANFRVAGNMKSVIVA